mgnify:CR=1 FL=1
MVAVLVEFGLGIGVAQRMLDTFAAGRDAARAIFEAGNSAELDLASQEVAYERARITVAQLELDAATASQPADGVAPAGPAAARG